MLKVKDEKEEKKQKIDEDLSPYYPAVQVKIKLLFRLYIY